MKLQQVHIKLISLYIRLSIQHFTHTIIQLSLPIPPISGGGGGGGGIGRGGGGELGVVSGGGGTTVTRVESSFKTNQNT